MATVAGAITEERHGERLLLGLVAAALIGGLSVTDARAILEPGAEEPAAAAAIVDGFAPDGPIDVRLGGLAPGGRFAGLGPGGPPRVGGLPLVGTPVPGPPVAAPPVGGPVGGPVGPLVPGTTQPAQFGQISPPGAGAPNIPGLPNIPGDGGFTAPGPTDVDPVAPAPPVPEPAAWALLILGFFGAGFGLRRAGRRNSATAA